jgi:molybdopterin-guanine dinucleotide biosynthesis protein
LELIALVVLLLAGLGFVLRKFFHFAWWHDAALACKNGPLGCGLVVHVIGTGIVAALVFYVVFLGRETWASFVWRWRAQRTPEALFTWLPPSGGVTGLAARKPITVGWRSIWRWRRESLRRLQFGGARSIVDNVVSRDGLVRDLARDLDAGGAIQILIGPTGSGKTMVLLKLVQHLAKRGTVPVAISLRETTHIDLESQAKAMYRRAYPNRTDEEVDKRWRWLRRGDDIVIIVDDLEKANPDQEDVVEALETAARDGLRIVAASRPSGIPPDYRQGRIDLEALDRDEVRKTLRKRINAVWSSEARAEKLLRLVNELLDKDEAVLTSPYFLAISRVLIDTGSLAKIDVQGARDARVALLDAYLDDLREGRLRVQSGLIEKTRRAVLDDLECVAVVSLGRPSTVAEVAAKAADIGGMTLPAEQAVEYGKRLGVLQVRYDNEVRFGHPTTMAYFASRFLARRSDTSLWQTTLDEIDLGSAAGLALILANATAHDPKLARMTCLKLLDRLNRSTPEGEDAPPPSGIEALKRGRFSGLFKGAEASANGARPNWNPNERLLVIKTAAEIARRQDAEDEFVSQEIVAAVRREKEGGGLPKEQIGLLRELVCLGSGRANDTLWEFATTAPDYWVKRAAMTLLVVEGGKDALTTTRAQVAATCGKWRYSRTGSPSLCHPTGETSSTGFERWLGSCPVSGQRVLMTAMCPTS